MLIAGYIYSIACLKRSLKKNTKTVFQCRSKLLQNAPGEYSAILSTFIKPPFIFKTFVLYFIEWPLKTSFTVKLIALYFIYLHCKCTNIINSFPAIHQSSTEDFGSLYCKQYNLRSDCSHRSSLTRVHNVCFHDESSLGLECIWMYVAITFSRQKYWQDKDLKNANNFVLASLAITNSLYWDYKNLSWVWGWDRKICPEDHRLASRGLPSDDKRWSWGTDFSIPSLHD